TVATPGEHGAPPAGMTGMDSEALTYGRAVEILQMAKNAGIAFEKDVPAFSNETEKSAYLRDRVSFEEREGSNYDGLARGLRGTLDSVAAEPAPQPPNAAEVVQQRLSEVEVTARTHHILAAYYRTQLQERW